MYAMLELLKQHRGMLHVHFVSLSNPVGASKMSAGTVVGLSPLDPSSCDQPYAMAIFSWTASLVRGSAVNIVWVCWPCFYQL